MSANLSCLGLKGPGNFPEPRFRGVIAPSGVLMILSTCPGWRHMSKRRSAPNCAVKSW